MNEDQILEEINRIFKEVFDNDNLHVNPNTTANDIDEWDSLMHIRLIISHEIKFNIKFTTQEITELKNVGEFAYLINSKLA